MRPAANEQIEPGRQACFGVGLQEALEERRIGLFAQASRRDQHQRQRLDPGVRDSAAATAPPSEWPTRCASARPLHQRCAGRLDQRLETRLFPEGRKPVTGKIERQSSLCPGHETGERSPGIEVGAKPVNEHDRRAGRALEPLAMDLVRRPRGARLVEVAQLDPPAGPRAPGVRQAQAALPRRPARSRGRAQAERGVGVGSVLRRGRRPNCGERSGRRACFSFRRKEILAFGKDPADAGADRQDVALGGGDEARHARSRRVDLHSRLIGFDLKQSFALDHPGAFGRMPAAHPPLVMSMSTRGMTICAPSRTPLRAKPRTA